MAAASAAVGAQGQAPVNQGSQGMSRGNETQTTWVGCLVRAEKQPSRPGTGDNTAKGQNASAPFTLKDAAPANAQRAAATREFGLRATRVDLAAHANHQVEVTARLVDARSAAGAGAQGSGAPGSDQPAPAPGSGTAAPRGANPQFAVLDVSAIRTLAAECPAR